MKVPVCDYMGMCIADRKKIKKHLRYLLHKNCDGNWKLSPKKNIK